MKTQKHQHRERLFLCCALLSVFVSILVLGSLLYTILTDGWPRFSFSLLFNYPSRFPDKAGIFSALIGSLYLLLLTALFSIPIGIGAAIYLEEYAPRNRLTRFIEINIANLAAIPSIIYGLLGLQVFVRLFGFDRSLLSGALTMSLLVLPVIIIAAREAIDAVPSSIKEASIALGATKSQTIFRAILPLASPSILTGCILGFSRAIGETAPLIVVGALAYVAFIPTSLFDPFTVLPIQIFNWISRPQTAFHQNAAAAILVLLFLLILFNAAAIVIRYNQQKKSRW